MMKSKFNITLKNKTSLVYYIVGTIIIIKLSHRISIFEPENTWESNFIESKEIFK